MLDRLANLIGKQKPEQGGGAKSWWRWPLLIMLVLIGIGVGGWLLWRSGKDRRELARLRSEEFQRKVEAEGAVTQAELDKNDAVAREEMAKVKESEERVVALDDALREAEERHERNKAAIDRITWSDLPRADGGG